MVTCRPEEGWAEVRLCGPLGHTLPSLGQEPETCAFEPPKPGAPIC